MERPFRLPNLDHQVEGLAHGARGPIGDEGSAAGVGFHQTLFAQSLDRLAYRGAAHSETQRQLAFRRKLVSRLEIPLDDRFFDLLNDLLVEP